MFLDQTEKITKTIAQVMIYHKSVLIFMSKERKKLKIKMDMLLKRMKIAMLAIGLQFTGRDILKVVLQLLIQDKKVTVFQKHLPLVHLKFSNVGIQQLVNLSKVIRLRSAAHLTTFGEVHILQHQLVESQFHFTLILISILKLLIAIEPQSLPNKSNNQLQPLSNQNNVFISILKNLKLQPMIQFYHQMTKSGDGGGQLSMPKLSIKSLMIQIKCGFKVMMDQLAMLLIQLTSSTKISDMS